MLICADTLIAGEYGTGTSTVPYLEPYFLFFRFYYGTVLTVSGIIKKKYTVYNIHSVTYVPVLVSFKITFHDKTSGPALQYVRASTILVNQNPQHEKSFICTHIRTYLNL